MTNKDFTPMPTAAANDGFHSWEGTKWESHPYLVVATGGGSCGGGEGAVGWMASAVSHAMTIRVMFTELDDDDETINDAMEEDGASAASTTTTTTTSSGGKQKDRSSGGGGSGGSSGGVFTTRSVLFDARRSTDELKAAMAAELNANKPDGGGGSGDTHGQKKKEGEGAVGQQGIDSRSFNALLKLGVKQTVLNKPDAPPFQLLKFRSGFSRLPCCIPVRLVRGQAADFRTRALALRWHVPGENQHLIQSTRPALAHKCLFRPTSMLARKLHADPHASMFLHYCIIGVMVLWWPVFFNCRRAWRGAVDGDRQRC
jgi:hypothetical protein